MASSPLTGGTWCLSSRNHRFYRKITINESRRTINDKPTVLLFMQKDDIMLFLTAVSDFGEKKLLVIESHSQVIKFQCFGFVAFQLRKESVFDNLEIRITTHPGGVWLFFSAQGAITPLYLYIRTSCCVCVCVVCLPVVLHYPAVLCSSSGERRLWIPLSASAVTLHPPLVAAEHHPRYHHHQLSYFYFCTPL